MQLFDDVPLPLRWAPEAIVCQAHYEPGRGWAVYLRIRGGGQAWDEAPADLFDHLSTPELLDTIEGVLSRKLGL